MFFVDVKEKCRRISNIELHYACITLKNGIVALCLCDDADLFSVDVLKQLLLTEDGYRAVMSVALSLRDGELKIRSVSLK